MGANVLTALILHSTDELAKKIDLYRQARAEHGHDPDSECVTLMIHAFVDEEMEHVRQTVRAPFIDYLRTSSSLWRTKSSRGEQIELTKEEEEDMGMGLLFESLQVEQVSYREIVYLWSIDGNAAQTLTTDLLEQAQERSVYTLLPLVQTVTRAELGQSSRLWLMTEHTQPAGDQEPATVTQAPLWGFGRVISNEYPELCCQRVDLGDIQSDGVIEALLAEFFSDGLEDEVALRESARYVPRCRQVSLAKLASTERTAPSVYNDTTYLITGRGPKWIWFGHGSMAGGPGYQTFGVDGTQRCFD